MAGHFSPFGLAGRPLFLVNDFFCHFKLAGHFCPWECVPAMYFVLHFTHVRGFGHFGRKLGLFSLHFSPPPFSTHFAYITAAPGLVLRVRKNALSLLYCISLLLHFNSQKPLSSYTLFPTSPNTTPPHSIPVAWSCFPEARSTQTWSKRLLKIGLQGWVTISLFWAHFLHYFLALLASTFELRP